jgi:polysaccharide pyruvyl transferase WcaK-like protein
LLEDRRYWRLAREQLGAAEAVIVAGGGQLDEFWGGPFGHPFALCRWARLARRAGARYLVLSVGTGTIESRLGKRFVRCALERADYRSFRDRRSRELAAAATPTADDPIVPDLAYALPLPADLPPPRAGVAVCPMIYADPRVWPAADAARYRRHIETFAELAVRLARAGQEVVIFGTTRADNTAVRDLMSRVEHEVGAGERRRVRSRVIDDVAELMRAFSLAEVVVAARLHGVVLAHVAGRPTLAVAHERKVKTLMHDIGQARYCIDIDDFDAASGWQRWLELRERRAELSTEISAVADRCRREVDGQLDRLFGGAP